MFKKYRLVIAIIAVSFIGVSFYNTFATSASTVFNPQDTEENNHTNDYDRYDDNWRQVFNYFYSKWNRGWEDQYDYVEQTPENGDDSEKQSEDDYSQQNNQQDEASSEPNQEVNVQKPQSNNSNGSYDALGEVSEFEWEVIRLTNIEREKYGLNPLQIDYELNRVAREKSRDMSVYNYFDHNSPIYGSPFDMMTSYAIQYRAAGENIAKGQRTPAEVVNAWMNSEGHRANILNGSFTHIGVGFLDNGHIWTQQFIGK